MATLVCFHAHPDDEAISTGGTMAKAAAEGHDVVLVLATKGELGEPVPGVLAPGEELWERRVVEARRSGELLGASRVEFLGYRDSGMEGEPTNEDPDCFWQAPIDEAAAKLATVLTDVGADVLTVYDHHGVYGHPDHIQVYRVGRRAAELAGTEWVFAATANRRIIRERFAELGEQADFDGERPDVDPDTFGEPEEAITHAVDVNDHVGAKRAAMATHQSQIGEASFFLQMPPEDFADAFGMEWFIDLTGRSDPGEPFATDLFAGLS